MFIKRGIIVGLILVLSMNLVFAQDISVDNIFVKVSVNGGDFITRSVSITSQEGGDINLNLLDLKGVSLSEESFYLNPGGTKKIDINFNSNGVDEGVYVGGLRILGSKEVYTLPIIFEIESANPFFDLDLEIPPQYREVSPGGEVLVQLKIFDLTAGAIGEGLGPTELNIEYFVHSIEGTIVTSQIEDIVLDKEAKVDKIISLPESLSKGDYVIVVVVDYASSIAMSTELISVVVEGEAEKKTFLEGVLDLGFLSILLIILVFFLLLWLFFVFLLKDRDKFILELKKYNARELRDQREFLEEQGKVVGKKSKLKTHARKIRTEIRRKTGKLREAQRKRLGKMRELKSKGELSEMRKKLKAWKKQGFNTIAFEYKLKGMNNKDMKKIMDKQKNKKTEAYKK